MFAAAANALTASQRREEVMRGALEEAELRIDEIVDLGDDGCAPWSKLIFISHNIRQALCATEGKG
jgi:hypothetical protein